MSVTMRIIQTFAPQDEKRFMELEREFARLEARRPDFPKGTRMQPISSSDPCHTLIWQGVFPDLAGAQAALDFFDGDPAHEELAAEQRPLFRDVRIEFYRNLEF
jgi:hypothetical protein